MNQIAELRTQVVTRGRRLKFTPERIQQIKNLVERGKSSGEIAELVGVTVGSLRVTCSRLGISLRQPRFKTGTGPLRRNGSALLQSLAAHAHGPALRREARSCAAHRRRERGRGNRNDERAAGSTATMAVTNKCLAQSNKSQTGGKATKKREIRQQG